MILVESISDGTRKFVGKNNLSGRPCVGISCVPRRATTFSRFLVEFRNKTLFFYFECIHANTCMRARIRICLIIKLDLFSSVEFLLSRMNENGLASNPFSKDV